MVSGAVVGLVQELQDEALIEPVTGSNGDESRRRRVDDGPNGAAASESSSGSGFVAPVLEKYTDMQDYMLLDPIHEAGGLGWPNLAGP